MMKQWSLGDPIFRQSYIMCLNNNVYVYNDIIYSSVNYIDSAMRWGLAYGI
jgi:hypothetical protein